MRRNDPRIRQTLNQISQNLESANLSTQASLFTFSQNYVTPCLSSFHTCLEASCHPCFTAITRDDHHHQRRGHHHRNARRGREELSFDFYDDWEEDGEGEWGNDELDRLLAGSDGHQGQPGKQRGMSYGSRGVRRKSIGLPKDGSGDPTIVPSSSVFGFLERLPWRIGGRGVRYRPSAADLQENVGKGRGRGEGEALIEESEESGAEDALGNFKRNRRDTAESTTTTNSLSSRGDLFPSEDEDDAVPIGDEFAMVLERRTTGNTMAGSDDHSSRKTRGKRPADSRASTKTASSRDTKSPGKRGRGSSTSSRKVPDVAEAVEDDVPSMTDLRREEERVRREEEAQVERKRIAAQRLALERGLGGMGDDTKSPMTPIDKSLEEPAATEPPALEVDAGRQPPSPEMEPASEPEPKPPEQLT